MDRYLLAPVPSLRTCAARWMPMTWRVRARRFATPGVLTNWYVRTQRQRFWDEDSAAFDTCTRLDAHGAGGAPAAVAGRGDLVA